MYFYCELCEYKTNKKYNLSRHQNAVHFKNELKNENEEKHIHFEEKHIQNEEKHIHFEEKHIHFEEKHIYFEEKHIQEIYNCEKCNKIYKTKKYLIEHQIKCNGINSLTCPKCMKSFSTTCNKLKHIKKNNCKARSIIHIDNNLKKDIYINGNNNNNTTNNTTINNTIINNFGSERTDYMIFDDMIKILNSGNNIIPKYIEYKHFNKDFPENHNIKYERNKGCLIKHNNKWNIANIDLITDKLINKNSKELLNYYNNKRTDIEDKIKNIEILEFIYSRLNYLDLHINKKLFDNIKFEIKNIIKYNNILY